MKKILFILTLINILISIQISAINTDLTQACDTFVLKNKERIAAKIISKEETRYIIERCDTGERAWLQRSQVKKIIRTRLYKTYKIFKNKNQSNVKVYLNELRDSTIIVSSCAKHLGLPLFEAKEILIKDIKRLKFRQKNSVFIGFGTGIAASLAIGLIAGGDPPCSGCSFDLRFSAWDKAVGVGAIIIPIKTIILGLSWKVVQLDGNLTIYTTQKAKLAKYAMKSS